jgi:ABC-2 type transport system ATP-binding protein
VGEKQKLSIIRALGHSPDFLVLDEPVASLDPAARREFLREVVSLSLDQDATVLFSTHILTDLERVAFDVAVLHEGKILLEGSLDRLAEEVVRVKGSLEALKLAEKWAVGAQSGNAGNGLLVRLPDPSLAAAAGLQVERLALEDMFIEVTQS